MSRYKPKELFWKLRETGEYEPHSAWACAANLIIKDDPNIAPEFARDHIIFEWLINGDQRPLQALLQEGKSPNEIVLKYLGTMLDENDPDENFCPYKLKIDRKGRKGKPANPENAVRDRLLSEYVGKYCKEAGYEYAITQTAQDLPGITRETIRKAYDKSKKDI